MHKVREFRALIFQCYDSEAQFARDMGWACQKLSKITNGQRTPSIDELAVFANYLSVTTGELAELFLRHKSPNGQHTA